MLKSSYIFLPVFLIFSMLLNVYAPADTKKPIVVASIFAKSGDGQLTSKYLLQGVRLAVDMINLTGGIKGQRIDLIELDNKSTALDTKKATMEAIDRNVVGIIGANWSSHSMVMASILQKAQIPMITPVSTLPAVTLQGDYIFRICFTDRFPARTMANFSIKTLNKKKAVILTNVNSDYSIEMSQYFLNAFLSLKGNLLWQGKYQQEDTDFNPILNKIKFLNPGIVFLPGYSRESSLILRQAEKKGINSIFINAGSWSIKTYKLAGDTIEGSYMADHWHSKGNFPRSRRVLEDYEKKYGDSESADATGILFAYDAMMLLADAIKRASSTNRTQIKKALQSTKDFPGVTGDITFDENGDPTQREVVVVGFHSGKINFVKSVSLSPILSNR